MIGLLIIQSAKPFYGTGDSPPLLGFCKAHSFLASTTFFHHISACSVIAITIPVAAIPPVLLYIMCILLFSCHISFVPARLGLFLVSGRVFISLGRCQFIGAWETTFGLRFQNSHIIRRPSHLRESIIWERSSWLVHRSTSSHSGICMKGHSHSRISNSHSVSVYFLGSGGAFISCGFAFLSTA